MWAAAASGAGLSQVNNYPDARKYILRNWRKDLIPPCKWFPKYQPPLPVDSARSATKTRTMDSVSLWQ